jgi:predicted restriction endonuclease
LQAILQRILTPTKSEEIRLSDQAVVDDASLKLPEFDQTDIEDGRSQILRAVAMRQGQRKFREKLLEAYDARCAVTGTSIPAALQAAHIIPYRGPNTNSVQNGLLLRADIHNLFDLGLLRVEPTSLRIKLAMELLSTGFGKLNGRKLRLPKKLGHQPSKKALEEREKLFS